MNTKTCPDCNCQISPNNYKKHLNSKQCLQNQLKQTDTDNKCKYCGITFDNFSGSQKANHTRWCEKNPKRSFYGMKGEKNHRFNKPAWNKGLTKMDDERVEKNAISLKKGYDSGKLVSWNKNKQKSDAEKEKDRQAALKSNHIRKCKRTHPYTDKQGRTFSFDSSWEDALADRLDFLDIQWDRPAPISYTDKSGIIRRYFPDFYLPEYKLYLDPKNPYVQKQQAEKIEIIIKKINLIILSSLEECRNFEI